MGTVETVLLILLIVDALALIGLVLIQQSKGADVGAAFGSGSAGAMFGPTGGSSFLVKVTTILAILFFVITFALAYTAKQRADRLSGFEFTEETPVTEVEQEIPDIGVDSQVDDSTILEGDELPILTPPSPGVEDTSGGEGSSDTEEDEVPQ
ncbi:MAG: preprotein translocase subunit SecG [Gammaproteobacteria bacterium]|nr:preprotein translocase subunit SecG [Gammaproteobacteria bacterium]